MGLVIKNLKVGGSKGWREVACFFDTGCSENLIREDIASSLTTIVELPHPMQFIMADGETVLETNKVVGLLITINGCEILEQALVVDKLSDEMIIGAETMQRRKIKLDLENERVTMDPKAAKLRV